MPTSDESPTYEICFANRDTFADPLAIGDAIRWVGPAMWRVEEVEGNQVTVRLWPDEEPYPEIVKDSGPDEWPFWDDFAKSS